MQKAAPGQGLVGNSIEFSAWFSRFPTRLGRSWAAGTVLKTAEAAKAPVVAVDVAPTSGPVAMVIDGPGLGL
jgi:hypothetical protein